MIGIPLFQTKKLFGYEKRKKKQREVFEVGKKEGAKTCDEFVFD